MISEVAINNAIQKGLTFIQNNQLPNGEFLCDFVSSDTEVVDDLKAGQGIKVVQERETIFPNTLIGHALLGLRSSPQAEAILDQISRYLLSHCNRFGLWKHYVGSQMLGRWIAYDLDNTAMTASLLESLGSKQKIATKFFYSNRAKNGLFYTWITWRGQVHVGLEYYLALKREFRHPIGQYYFWKLMPCAKRDIDAVVNSNVLFYLGYNAQTAPIAEWMVEIIQKSLETTCDKWYKRPIQIYYFFSKNFSKDIPKLEPLKAQLKEIILRHLTPQGRFFDSELDTALAITALCNASYGREVPQRAVQYLLEQQQADGSWQKWSINYGKPDRTVGFGSQVLTTSYVLEALNAYQSLGLSNSARR